MPENIERDILIIEKREQRALQSFIEKQIYGPTNLWDPLKKEKLLNWGDACKSIKLKDAKGSMELKATNSNGIPHMWKCKLLNFSII